MLLFADRFVALDHHTGQVHLVHVHQDSKSAQTQAQQWLRHVSELLRSQTTDGVEAGVQQRAASGRKHRRHVFAAASRNSAPAPVAGERLRPCWQHRRRVRNSVVATHPAAAAHAYNADRANTHLHSRQPAAFWRPPGDAAKQYVTSAPMLDAQADNVGSAQPFAWQRTPQHGSTAARHEPQHGHAGTQRRGTSVAEHASARATFELQRSEQRYLRDIAACQDALHRGDSYEICLTNKLRASLPGLDPWRFYQTLRRVNAAPHAAWLHCGKVRCLHLVL